MILALVDYKITGGIIAHGTGFGSPSLLVPEAEMVVKSGGNHIEIAIRARAGWPNGYESSRELLLFFFFQFLPTASRPSAFHRGRNGDNAMINSASGASAIILSHDNDFHRAVTLHHRFFHFGGTELLKTKIAIGRVPRDRDSATLIRDSRI